MVASNATFEVNFSSVISRNTAGSRIGERIAKPGHADMLLNQSRKNALPRCGRGGRYVNTPISTSNSFVCRASHQHSVACQFVGGTQNRPLGKPRFDLLHLAAEFLESHLPACLARLAVREMIVERSSTSAPFSAYLSRAHCIASRCGGSQAVFFAGCDSVRSRRAVSTRNCTTPASSIGEAKPCAISFRKRYTCSSRRNSPPDRIPEE